MLAFQWLEICLEYASRILNTNRNSLIIFATRVAMMIGVAVS